MTLIFQRVLAAVVRLVVVLTVDSVAWLERLTDLRLWVCDEKWMMLY